MEIVWFGALALLLAGYFALEGFDIGVGMLLPVLGRDQAARDRLVGAIAPFVLANEVWLVAGVGVLFGAFPTLEGDVLFALYPLVVALLVSWIVRDAGLWFRRRVDGPRWRAFWDGALCAGSWGLALTWGFALARVATGLDGLPALLLGVVLAAVVAAVFAFHGRTFAAWRLAGEGRPRGGRALLGSALLAASPALAGLALTASTVVGHAAPAGTLNMLGLMVVPFAPLMVGAQIWVWRTFGPRRPAGSRVPSFF
ncbi:cytochrome BD ubiquinol oxidase subunit II [Spongiactinospora gelatinilytica]|uniref:Cytochrome BD ubiquinol oxidase subunit II n=1 Tax=Spongiactinospora gelatinilytica TaxID=2666298 RepID=A0A2W2GUB6_9ACTN|nr:cytochrome d ubiquinol oxidase subunit II [Spongiactinospora gelatinilytica]PZG51512.1 cytochrome BD ubiquinol oxidase subunit II [Spongiactinospora gelatinilytica]